MTGHGVSYYRHRGAGCQKKKYLAAGLGEEFSLDTHFHM